MDVLFAIQVRSMFLSTGRWTTSTGITEEYLQIGSKGKTVSDPSGEKWCAHEILTETPMLSCVGPLLSRC